MLLHIQNATATPADWQSIDSSEWSTLPKKDIPPDANPVIDDRPGWINFVSCQMIFSGDHYCVEDQRDGCHPHLFAILPQYKPASNGWLACAV